MQKIEESKTEIQVTGKVISYSGKKDVKESEVFNTLMIPGGGEFQLVLADGTRVWLNAQTEFRYPVNFTGDSRQVYLNGEAYFEVVKDERRPFIVRTEAVDIRVLGTCFNVNDDQGGRDVGGDFGGGEGGDWRPGNSSAGCFVSG